MEDPLRLIATVPAPVRNSRSACRSRVPISRLARKPKPALSGDDVKALGGLNADRQAVVIALAK
jgi:hypothetical protein